MSKVVGIAVIVILIALFSYFLFSTKQTTPESSLSKNTTSTETAKSSATPMTDIQASFAIFTNGTFRVFTATMYHNLSQDAYIKSSNPNIVHVKKAGTTWKDFFSTLPFKLTSECLTTGTKETFCTGEPGTLKFYINGEQNNNALDQEIKQGDKLLVTFGNESEETIKKQFNRIP